MELNWSTFILEIINFLILVWLLSRFLYRPVLKIIHKRRREIQEKLDAADQVRNEAEALKGEYQDRLTDWEREKHDAGQQLEKEIATERGRRLAELKRELEREREKAGVLNRRQMEEEKLLQERQALQLGAAFSSRLLTRLAGPELENQLIDLLIADLQELPEEKRQSLRNSYAKGNTGITIDSVFPVTADKRHKIEQVFNSVFNQDIHCAYRQQPELIAGLQIRVGAWLLQANLRDELGYFAEIDNRAG